VALCLRSDPVTLSDVRALVFLIHAVKGILKEAEIWSFGAQK